MKRFLLVAGAVACLPGVARAQITHMDPGSETRFGVEIARPFLETEGLAWYSSAVRGRVLKPISPSTQLLVDVGLSIAGADAAGMDATFANPELGVVFVNSANKARGHLTVVVPVGFSFGGDDISAGTGILTDFFRLDRYADEIVSVNAGFTPSGALGESAELTGELTAATLIPTGDGDAEVFARYGAGIRAFTPAVRVSGRIEGFAVVSEGDLSFSERTIHRLVFAVDGVRGGPGLFVQVPLDEELDEIQAVAGLTFVF